MIHPEGRRASGFSRSSASASCIWPFRRTGAGHPLGPWGWEHCLHHAACGSRRSGCWLSQVGFVMLICAAVSMLGFSGLFGAGLLTLLIVFVLGVPLRFLPRYIASVHPTHRTRAPGGYCRLCARGRRLGVYGSVSSARLIHSNIAGLIVYAMVAMAAVMLRRRHVRADGEPFRCPGGPLATPGLSRNWSHADRDRDRPGPGWRLANPRPARWHRLCGAGVAEVPAEARNPHPPQN